MPSVASGSDPGAPRSKRAARRNYDRLSRVYDLLAGPFEAPLADAALELLAPRPGEAVLEIGFGPGRALAVLARAVGDAGTVDGIDLSEGMRRRAAARLERAGLRERVALHRGDAAALPFEAARFDAVFIAFTLELFDTPEIPVVLAECRRVLREGGRLGVVSLARRDPPSFAERVYTRLHRWAPVAFDCRPIFVARALEAAGFRVCTVERRVSWGLGIDIALAERGADEARREAPEHDDGVTETEADAVEPRGAGEGGGAFRG